MFKGFKKGFTLIELLVVIAIIGILASIVLVSLNGARAKGRDAKRVADLQQFARAVALSSNADSASAFAGCTTAGVKASTCTDPNGTGFTDPSGGVACAAGALTATCDYTVSAASAFTTAAKFNDWQVKTYLENGAGTLTSGAVCISSGTSTISSVGCK